MQLNIFPILILIVIISVAITVVGYRFWKGKNKPNDSNNVLDDNEF